MKGLIILSTLLLSVACWGDSTTFKQDCKKSNHPYCSSAEYLMTVKEQQDTAIKVAKMADIATHKEPCHETTPLEAWSERINPPNKTKELISSKFRKCSDVKKIGEILRESGNTKNIQYVIDYSQNEAFKGASFVENNISSIDNNEIWSVSCGNITNKGILQKECKIRQRNLLILMHPHEFPQIAFGGSNLKIKGISLLNYKIDNNPIFTLPVNIIDKSIASNKILTQLKNGENLTYTLPKKSSKSFDTNYINLKGLNESLELADKILISNVSISD